jgi:hypothetical protein
MAVSEGKFVLYSRIEPPLPAGDYRLTARQRLGASGSAGALSAAELPVAELPTHVRVRSPRFALPPDQALSTFPPANREGNFGLRLPQIVIKRRTLPWERLVSPTAPAGVPWLALVLIAEGEAELKTNRPIAECITPGLNLDGVADAENGNYLLVRRSIVHKIFPTRLDVPLLAHAREVDIHDTELMLGDDDGFLAVVISNRLPLPGRTAAGDEVPVKYLACLVNLERQFDVLLPRAPDPTPSMQVPQIELQLAVDLADWDRRAMGLAPVRSELKVEAELEIGGAPRAPRASDTAPRRAASRSAPTLAGASAVAGGAEWSTTSAPSADDVYLAMARPFALTALEASGVFVAAEPTYRFPVLLHWSFTSVGDTTFRKLMEDLDSGLLGTTLGENAGGAPGASPPPVAGRLPLESVETGHVGLPHRTRRGDEVRSWYRGPFVPHPTLDPPEGRLPLAHASDQLRIIVPDGREDLSLASAFEIGRLLALARPSMVAALLRWRQLHYKAARQEAIWQVALPFLGDIAVEVKRFGPDLGLALGRRLARAIVSLPETFLGAPRAVVDAGLPLDLEGPALDLLSAGFGLPADVLAGEGLEVDVVLEQLRRIEVPVGKLPGLAEGGVLASLGRSALAGVLEQQVFNLAKDTLPREFSLAGIGAAGGIAGGIVRPSRRNAAGPREGKQAPSRARPAALPPDALDKLLDLLSKEESQ